MTEGNEVNANSWDETYISLSEMKLISISFSVLWGFQKCSWQDILLF